MSIVIIIGINSSKSTSDLQVSNGFTSNFHGGASTVCLKEYINIYIYILYIYIFTYLLVHSYMYKLITLLYVIDYYQELKRIWQSVLRECHRSDPERVGQISRVVFINALEKSDAHKVLL